MTIKTARDAKLIQKQHTTPCEDCPWRRAATPSWLGGSAFKPGALATADEWLHVVHGDGFIGCHTRKLPIVESTTPDSARVVPAHLALRDPDELRSAGSAQLFPGEAQCAGAATFRANVCKSPRDDSILVLKPNRTTVFATSEEFRAHHQTEQLTQRRKKNT